MNRRRFLLNAGITGGTLGLGGGFLLLQRNNARAALASQMLNDAIPPLTESSLSQLTSLPARAREEIRTYFHGKCLNVDSFVSHICSHQFAERLGRCRTQDQRESCFLHAFCGRVATAGEILNQVQIIAAETGSELDAAWGAYCTELRGRWNTRIHGYGRPLSMDELSNRLGGMVRTELAQAARQSVSAYQRPAVGESIGKIGASALLLLPLATITVVVTEAAVGAVINPLVIPVFVILAARHIWDYVAGLLDNRRGEYQAAISGQLAVLGNRVGAEFEREIRQRLTDLHTWQEQTVRGAATRLAVERVGFWGGLV